MKFHCAIVDQLCGFDGFKFVSGTLANGLVEAEVISNYSQAVMDCFEWLGIQHEVIQTRKRPGFPEVVRLSQMTDGKLGMRFGLGTVTDEKSNASRITYTRQELKPLAVKLARQCFEWAVKLNPHHLDGGAVFVDSPDVPPHLVIEPFAINGAGSFNLTSQPHMDELGKRLGKVTGDWLKEQNPTQVGFRPKQVMEHPAMQQAAAK